MLIPKFLRISRLIAQRLNATATLAEYVVAFINKAKHRRCRKRDKSIGRPSKKTGSFQSHCNRSRNGIRLTATVSLKLIRPRIAEIAPVIVIHTVVRRESPVAHAVGWKPIRRECFAFAQERSILNTTVRVRHCRFKPLDVIFASEAVRVKCDLVSSAPTGLN